MSQVDLLVIGAHPDDVEIGMGGTIVKHTRLGYRVGIVDLTRGDLGANGTPDQRVAEGERASEILGCSFRYNLGLPDGQVVANKDNVAKVVEVIRKTRPRLVFAPYYEDKHPDHVACGKLAEESMFMATVVKYLPELLPHSVKQLLFYAVNPQIVPNLIVDVTNEYEVKIQAVLAHKSQFFFHSGSVATEINKENGYPDRLKVRNQYLGLQIGAAYGEGFVVKAPIPCSDLLNYWGRAID